MCQIRGCAFPDDLYFDHDLNLWFRRIDALTFEVGITPFGHALSGDLYMYNPKPVGREIAASRAFALVEAAKTVLPVRTPFDATIVQTNPEPESRPALINRDPFGTWLVHLRAVNHDEAMSVLMHGDQIEPRAETLMDLFNFKSLETYAKGSAI